MKVDHKTIEKGLLSTVVALQQAYMMSLCIPEKDAKAKVMELLSKEVVPLLGQESTSSRAKAILREAVDSLIEEYNSKKDKAYLGLLRLRELLT